MADIYDPKQVIFTFGNKPLSAGIVDGTFITVTKNNDVLSLNVGSDGGATIQVDPNDSYIVEATYRAGSQTNSVIEGLRSEQDAGIYRVSTLTIEDMNGVNGSRTFVEDENAAITGPPLTTSFSQTEDQKTWKWILPKGRLQTHGTKSPARIGEGNV